MDPDLKSVKKIKLNGFIQSQKSATHKFFIGNKKKDDSYANSLVKHWGIWPYSMKKD